MTLTMHINGFAQSVIGGREMNQDSFLCEPARGLFAVADGVGGGLKGEVASRLAMDTFLAAAVTPESMLGIMESAQKAVLKEALNLLGDALMGTTCTALLLSDDKATVCHVGDSHCYLYTDGRLQQMTEDHEVFDEGLKATVLCSYLGIPPDIHPLQIQREVFPVAAGQRLLLCSDGLYRQLTDMQIVTIIKQHFTEPQKLVEKLCADAASSTDYSDNVTVVYVELT